MKRCPHCNSPITQPDRKTCPVCGKVLLKKKDKAQTLYCVTPGCTYTFNKDDAGEKDGE